MIRNLLVVLIGLIVLTCGHAQKSGVTVERMTIGHWEKAIGSDKYQDIMRRTTSFHEGGLEQVCQKNGLDQFQILERRDGAKIVLASSGRYTHYVTVNMVSVNNDAFSSVMKDGDIKRYFEQMQDVFGLCGIEVRPGTIEKVEGSDEYDRINMNDNKFLLGTEEECLYSKFHQPDEITAYFPRGIRSNRNSRSHSRRQSWFTEVYLPSSEDAARQTFDVNFVGSIMIFGADVNFGQQAPFVMPHEVGHILFNEDHKRTREPNIMSGRLDGLAYVVTSSQCEKAKNSPFVNPI